MTLYPGCLWRPQLIDHVYWKEKRQFLLDEDTYSYWTLFAVEEGKFFFEISEFRGQAVFGDLVFCPPGASFRRKVIEPLTFHFYTFDWIQLAEPMDKNGESQLPIGKITLNDKSRLSSDYVYLRQPQALNLPVSFARKAHFLLDLWHMYCMEHDTPEEDAAELKVMDPLIHEVTMLIRDQAYRQISFKDIAQSAGLSPVQLTRRFRARHGVSPMDYLTALRLKRAQTLLLETNYTLDRIALHCGYENGFYLSRVFSKKLDMNPSQFRAAYKL